jgi:cell division septal protein FtsQ
MAGGGRTEPGSRRRARAESAVVPLTRQSAGDRLDLVRLLPSGRSLFATFAIVVVALGGYWMARETSLFAVQDIEVRGAPPQVTREVQRAARRAVGTSLLQIDAAAIEGSVQALPSVAAASVDRAFPHTLVIRVAPVWPVGVARRGADAWLVSGSNRVIRKIDPRAEPGLPRLWLPRKTPVELGRPLPTSYEPVTRVFAGLREVRIPGRVKAVRTTPTGLVVVLHSGVEITLGAPTDVLVKLAVAAKVAPILDDGMLYLDVSVPERPVASRYLNSQVESESLPTTEP